MDWTSDGDDGRFAARPDELSRGLDAEQHMNIHTRTHTDTHTRTMNTVTFTT